MCLSQTKQKKGGKQKQQETNQRVELLLARTQQGHNL
jgi:hypothetical protein